MTTQPDLIHVLTTLDHTAFRELTDQPDASDDDVLEAMHRLRVDLRADVGNKLANNSIRWLRINRVNGSAW